MLHKIIDFAFISGTIPDEWRSGTIVPIPKGNNDPRDPLSYRPITLISIPCKIYADILNKRLSTWLEANNLLSDCQNGFRKARSCTDHIYTLYSIANNRKTMRKSTFACFIDARKAFDTVQRDCLWFKLLSLGINGRIFTAIQSLYDNVTCNVRINDVCTDWFPVNQGLKQGCVLSPTMFSIYVNDLAEMINNLGCGVTVDQYNMAILMYADDIVLLSESEHDMQRMLDAVNEWCYKWRLSLNESKTKVIHFRPPSFPKTNYQFMCGNKTISTEASYKYLGMWLNEFLDMTYSVKEIAKSASRALGAIFAKYMCSGGMNYSVFTKLVETVVEPVLFYGSGIWGLNHYREIDSVLNKACRYFLGTGNNASTTAVRGDMGWYSCSMKQKLESTPLVSHQKHG